MNDRMQSKTMRLTYEHCVLAVMPETKLALPANTQQATKYEFPTGNTILPTEFMLSGFTQICGQQLFRPARYLADLRHFMIGYTHITTFRPK